MTSRVYHGTSERAAQSILKDGIRPRARSRKKGNWKHTIQSNENFVYMTAAYGIYFAASAVNTKRDGRPTVIEVDLSALDEWSLQPDEDFIAAALKRKPEHKHRSLVELNRYVIERADNYQANWKLSLEHLGNVCHEGTVPVSSITRAVSYDPGKQTRLAVDSLNPTITVMNYGLCGEHYRALTAWLMGEDVPMLTLAFSTPMPAEAMQHAPWLREAVEQTTRHYGSRDGIETLFQREAITT